MDVCSFTLALLALLVTLVVLYIVRMSRHFGLFTKQGIKGPKPWPGLGNLPAILNEGFLRFFDRIYKTYENEKVVGVHEPGKAFFVVKDLDMLREILIKNFNAFANHRIFLDKEPFDNIMVNIKDDHWRHVRNAVSPTFSSGRLKRLFSHIEDSCKTLMVNLRGACKEGKNLELKEIISCFSMDCIGSAGFGVKLDSLNESNSQFVAEAKNIFSSFTGPVLALTILVPWIPSVLDKLGINLLPQKSARFFFKFVDDVMASRKEIGSTEKRHDYLQLMMDAEEESKSEGGEKKTKGLTHGDFQGQALIFLLAGYDTVSSAMSFTLFVLAHQPEALKKAQEEVDRVLGGKSPTYESASELNYLEMCLYETMRMYPPGFMLDRECGVDCTIDGYHFPKNSYVIIPVWSIHNDPKHYPEPEKFDPERFNAENKANRHPLAFMPFGQGPRICLGMRLAMLEIKIALAYILQELTPVPCEKSVYPLEMDKHEFKTVHGLWVKFVFRKT